MKRIVKLTESDLTRIVRRVLRESEDRIPKDDSSKIIYSDFKREKPLRGVPREGYSLEEKQLNYEVCTSKSIDYKIQSENKDLSEEKREAYRLAWENAQRECKNSWFNEMGKLRYKDIIYGYYKRYNGDPEEYVLASLDELYSNGSVLQMGSSIIYNCESGEIEYKGRYQPGSPGHGGYTAKFDIDDPAQQERDKVWLSYYCDSINWTSRVGKKDNMFRNVLDISDIIDRPKNF